MSREKVGKSSYDLLKKTPDSNDPIEIERVLNQEYEKNVWECIKREKKKFSGDFFVVVENRRERLMRNVFRQQFYGRQSCPTPNYDQTVYHYHRENDYPELIWVIPDRYTCITFKENVLQIDPEERELLGFVLDYSDGTLYKKARRLNGEAEI